MKNVERYQRVPVVHYPEREWPGKEIQKAPAWCSVDLSCLLYTSDAADD